MATGDFNTFIPSVLGMRPLDAAASSTAPGVASQSLWPQPSFVWRSRHHWQTWALLHFLYVQLAFWAKEKQISRPSPSVTYFPSPSLAYGVFNPFALPGLPLPVPLPKPFAPLPFSFPFPFADQGQAGGIGGRASSSSRVLLRPRTRNCNDGSRTSRSQ